MVDVARAATQRTSLTSTYLAAARRARPASSLPTPTLAVVRVDEWPFPFPPPEDARPGDNVVVAVNTIDDSALFEMTSSLAWTADGTVDSTNVAYAAASCQSCTTTAVAFQVVISIGRVDVAVPINEAVAVNHECSQCVTQAVAVQLMVTLEDEPTPEVLEQIELLWSQVALLEQQLEDQPAPVIHRELTRVRDEIVQVISTGRTGTLDEQGNWTEVAAPDQLHFAREPEQPVVEVAPHTRVGEDGDGGVDGPTPAPHVRAPLPADDADVPDVPDGSDVVDTIDPVEVTETIDAGEATGTADPIAVATPATDGPTPAPSTQVEPVAVLPEPVAVIQRQTDTHGGD